MRYKPKIESMGVIVKRTYRIDGRIAGFPGELRQVFGNLVGNAVEAMNGSGTLEVRISRTPGSLRPRVVITLADSGPGIHVNNAQKVFEPFFTTKGEKGTGLGLWISKEIIRKHGGSIRLRTRMEPGRSGTVFRVCFPLMEGDFAALRAANGR